jgi:hypothetical protein
MNVVDAVCPSGLVRTTVAGPEGFDGAVKEMFGGTPGRIDALVPPTVIVAPGWKSFPMSVTV